MRDKDQGAVRDSPLASATSVHSPSTSAAFGQDHRDLQKDLATGKRQEDVRTSYISWQGAKKPDAKPSVMDGVQKAADGITSLTGVQDAATAYATKQAEPLTQAATKVAAPLASSATSKVDGLRSQATELANEQVASVMGQVTQEVEPVRDKIVDEVLRTIT